MLNTFVIGILGAESTGKTRLAIELQEALDRPHRPVVVVAEYLREFCDRHQRTPRQDEQAAIAAEQTRRIQTVARSHAIVIADTTALMTAVYSELVFGDTSLYVSGEAAHRCCDLTLLTALDLPWQEDGTQRDGPQVQKPVDALVRKALKRAGSAYSVVCGAGSARAYAALASVGMGMNAQTGVRARPEPPCSDASLGAPCGDDGSLNRNGSPRQASMQPLPKHGNLASCYP